MKSEEKNEYIKYLENRIYELSQEESHSIYSNETKSLIKILKDLVAQHYGDRDWLIAQNKLLVNQVNNLQRTIAFDDEYINFLINSIWWKGSLPFRIFSRNRMKKRFSKNKVTFSIDNSIENVVPLEKKVLILISTYNANEEFSIQLDSLLKQKLLKNFEIVVVDRGSVDNTIKISKSKGLRVLSLFNIQNDNSYAESTILSEFDYVVYIDQNKIIEDDYWIFKAIKPIENNQAIMTAIFDESMQEMVESIKKESFFDELKLRLCLFDNHYFLYLPLNRNNIQFINPWFLKNASIVVRKIK